MKVATIIGARPQFIKAAPVSHALANSEMGPHIDEILIHTGQHYDAKMSQVFFEQLGLADPHYNLGAGGGNHGEQTGRMLQGLEEVLMSEKPDRVLIYGDTNSTLAGALTAAKLLIPIAHVEAGLRSFNRKMPEEINRVVADHLANLLLAPTETAVTNLESEGIRKGVYLVGDVMQDAVAENVSIAAASSTVLQDNGLRCGEYLLVTVHRAENTNDVQRLTGILDALRILSKDHVIVWPVHPRIRSYLDRVNLASSRIRLLDPVSYRDALWLQHNAILVMTDSGGIQKEAHWLQTPCVTLRDETEWVETLTDGWNRLAGCDTEKIVQAAEVARHKYLPGRQVISASGAARRIADLMRAN